MLSSHHSVYSHTFRRACNFDSPPRTNTIAESSDPSNCVDTAHSVGRPARVYELSLPADCRLPLRCPLSYAQCRCWRHYDHWPHHKISDRISVEVREPSHGSLLLSVLICAQDRSRQKKNRQFISRKSILCILIKYKIYFFFLTTTVFRGTLFRDANSRICTTTTYNLAILT